MPKKPVVDSDPVVVSLLGGLQVMVRRGDEGLMADWRVGEGFWRPAAKVEEVSLWR